MQISNRDVVRILAITTAFIGVLWLAFLLRAELVLVGTSFFLAIAINPLVEKVRLITPRHNRPIAIAVVFLLLVGLIGGIGWLLLPILISQTHVLLHSLPGYADQFSNSSLGHLVGPDLAAKLRGNQKGLLSEVFFNRGGSVFHFLRQIFDSVIIAATALAITFFMLLEGPVWIERFWAFQPASERAHRQKLAAAMYLVINRYVTVNLLFALTATVLSAGMMLWLGVPFAVPLAMVVGLLELLPLVGGILASGLVIAISLLVSFKVALVMTIFFLIYQHLKSNVLQPLILGKTIDLSPLLVLVSVVFGVALAGVVGALVAIPVGGCVQILIRDLLASRGGLKRRPNRTA